MSYRLTRIDALQLKKNVDHITKLETPSTSSPLFQDFSALIRDQQFINQITQGLGSGSATHIKITLTKKKINVWDAKNNNIATFSIVKMKDTQRIVFRIFDNIKSLNKQPSSPPTAPKINPPYPIAPTTPPYQLLFSRSQSREKASPPPTPIPSPTRSVATSPSLRQPFSIPSAQPFPDTPVITGETNSTPPPFPNKSPLTPLPPQAYLEESSPAAFNILSPEPSTSSQNSFLLSERPLTPLEACTSNLQNEPVPSSPVLSRMLSPPRKKLGQLKIPSRVPSPEPIASSSPRRVPSPKAPENGTLLPRRQGSRPSSPSKPASKKKQSPSPKTTQWSIWNLFNVFQSEPETQKFLNTKLDFTI